MSKEIVCFEVLESRTVLSTFSQMEMVFIAAESPPSQEEIRIAELPSAQDGSIQSPGLGWVNASEQGLEHGFQGSLNGEAVGWWKNGGDVDPGKSARGQDQDNGNSDNNPDRSTSTSQGLNPSSLNSKNDKDKDEKVNQGNSGGTNSAKFVGPLPPSGYSYSSASGVTSSHDPSSENTAQSSLVGISAKPGLSETEARAITVSTDVSEQLDFQRNENPSLKNENKEGSDPSVRLFEIAEEKLVALAAIEPLEDLRAVSSPAGGEEALELANAPLVLSLPQNRFEPMTDATVSHAGLDQAIQRFLDDLDNLAEEAGQTLAHTPTWVWVVAMGAGAGTLGLVRQRSRRRQATITVDPSWVPGLPPISSQKV